MRRHAFGNAVAEPFSDRRDLLIRVGKVSTTGSTPLKTEIVPRRLSALPSTSASAGGSNRSAQVRI
jgi:hypothetical protein